MKTREPDPLLDLPLNVDVFTSGRLSQQYAVEVAHPPLVNSQMPCSCLKSPYALRSRTRSSSWFVPGWKTTWSRLVVTLQESSSPGVHHGDAEISEFLVATPETQFLNPAERYWRWSLHPCSTLSSAVFNRTCSPLPTWNGSNFGLPFIVFSSREPWCLPCNCRKSSTTPGRHLNDCQPASSVRLAVLVFPRYCLRHRSKSTVLHNEGQPTANALVWGTQRIQQRGVR